jgi:hypothetical protein
VTSAGRAESPEGGGDGVRDRNGFASRAGRFTRRPSRLSVSYADIARSGPMLVHGTSAMKPDDARGAPFHSRSVTPSDRHRHVSDRARAVHLPWCCNDVGRRARTVRSGRGEQFSRRRATVSNGGQRAEEKKVEERNRAFGGRTRFCCESCPSPPNAERAPCPSFGRGERVPFIEPFSPPPLGPPSPVARSSTWPCSPRPLHPRPRRPFLENLAQ